MSSTQMRKTVGRAGLGRNMTCLVWGTITLGDISDILTERSSRSLNIYEFRVKNKCVNTNMNYRLIGIEVI